MIGRLTESIRGASAREAQAAIIRSVTGVPLRRWLDQRDGRYCLRADFELPYEHRGVDGLAHYYLLGTALLANKHAPVVWLDRLEGQLVLDEAAATTLRIEADRIERATVHAVRLARPLGTENGKALLAAMLISCGWPSCLDNDQLFATVMGPTLHSAQRLQA